MTGLNRRFSTFLLWHKCDSSRKRTTNWSYFLTNFVDSKYSGFEKLCTSITFRRWWRAQSFENPVCSASYFDVALPQPVYVCVFPLANTFFEQSFFFLPFKWDMWTTLLHKNWSWYFGFRFEQISVHSRVAFKMFLPFKVAKKGTKLNMLQAALVIRGLFICGFAYSRSKNCLFRRTNPSI
jgi:hypothetical protein